MEIYKDIPDYKGFYQASDCGNIRSIERTISHPRMGAVKLKSKVLATALVGGYLVSHLSMNGKKKLRFTHRLIAAAFHPNPKGLAQVNHINGIKHDNRAENLEWVSSKENIAHAVSAGLRDLKGEKNKKAKLSATQVLEIRALPVGQSAKEIGDKYGVDGPCIWKILSNKTWKHLL